MRSEIQTNNGEHDKWIGDTFNEVVRSTAKDIGRLLSLVQHVYAWPAPLVESDFRLFSRLDGLPSAYVQRPEDPGKGTTDPTIDLFPGYNQWKQLVELRSMPKTNLENAVRLTKEIETVLLPQVEKLEEGTLGRSPEQLVSAMIDIWKSGVDLGEQQLSEVLIHLCNLQTELCEKIAVVKRSLAIVHHQISRYGLTSVAKDPGRESDLKMYGILGDRLVCEGDLKSAVQAYSRGYGLNKFHPVLVISFAETLARLGMHQRVVEVLEPVVKTIGLAHGFTLLGCSYRETGDVNGAQSALLRAIELDSRGEMVAHRVLGELAIESERLKGARSRFCLEFDEQFTCQLTSAISSSFRLRIFSPNEGPVVIATWDDRSSGASITSCAETIMGIVLERFKIDPEKVIWLEHYEQSFFSRPTLDQVSFEVASDRTIKNVTWSPFDFKECEKLTGVRLMWQVRDKTPYPRQHGKFERPRPLGRSQRENVVGYAYDSDGTHLREDSVYLKHTPDGYRLEISIVDVSEVAFEVVSRAPTKYGFSTNGRVPALTLGVNFDSQLRYIDEDFRHTRLSLGRAYTFSQYTEVLRSGGLGRKQRHQNLLSITQELERKMREYDSPFEELLGLVPENASKYEKSNRSGSIQTVVNTAMEYFSYAAGRKMLEVENGSAALPAFSGRVLQYARVTTPIRNLQAYNNLSLLRRAIDQS